MAQTMTERQMESEANFILASVEAKEARREREDTEWMRMALDEYVETVHSIRFVEGVVEGVQLG